MTESPRVLRGVPPLDPVADDCVLFNFIFTDSFGVQEERDARLALYGVVDCDGSRAGRSALVQHSIAPLKFGAENATHPKRNISHFRSAQSKTMLY